MYPFEMESFKINHQETKNLRLSLLGRKESEFLELFSLYNQKR